jgi:hypothetical protein
MQIYSIFWNDIMKITNLINENVIIIFLKQKNRITLEIISISPINFPVTAKNGVLYLKEQTTNTIFIQPLVNNKQKNNFVA